MVRHNNQLPTNLTQLQNLIKRDKESYYEDFTQQYKHFESTVEIFRLNPTLFNKKVEEQIMFIAQVAQCYPDDLKSFPQKIVDLLRNHNTVLDSEMRMSFCKALILLRNKNLITSYDLLELFFELLRCQDKNLRDFLQSHIITDIKNINAKHKDIKVNSTLQNFIFSMVKDTNTKAAKMAVDIMIELYTKNVWNDSKTVNYIANVGCFSKITKVMVASLKFFLGKDEEEEEQKGSDSDSDHAPDPLAMMKANKYNKKSKKREKQVKKLKKAAKKIKKDKTDAPEFAFSALLMLNNPQGLAENLFKQVEKMNERFEVKLMSLDLISRLIGLHNLFVFNYYPFLARLLVPHQREVTRLLQFVAQASHELVPHEVLEPAMKAIANNFITERNSTDVMAVGLNAVREICARCPLAISEDLLRDLVQYRTYKHKSVMAAANSLLKLYQTSIPTMLHKKDRGRPTEASIELKVKKYGEVDVKGHIPGSEVLLEPAPAADAEECESDDSGEWEDVNNSDSDEESGDEEDESVEEPSKATVEPRKYLKRKDILNVVREEKIEKARQIISEKILDDEDFQRIDSAQIEKQVQAVRGKKRALEEELGEKSELVKLGDIENIFKKKRSDKDSRLQSIHEGREDRAKYGYKDRRINEHCSKTNREKRKTKNFQMIIHKARGKAKRSFKDKQISLRDYLIKQKKMR